MKPSISILPILVISLITVVTSHSDAQSSSKEESNVKKLTAEQLSISNVKQFVNDNNIRTVEQFVPLLPKELRQTFVSVSYTHLTLPTKA